MIRPCGLCQAPMARRKPMDAYYNGTAGVRPKGTSNGSPWKRVSDNPKSITDSAKVLPRLAQPALRDYKNNRRRSFSDTVLDFSRESQRTSPGTPVVKPRARGNSLVEQTGERVPFWLKRTVLALRGREAIYFWFDAVEL